MSQTEIEHHIRSFIVETFLFGQDDAALTSADSLLAKGIVDSTGVLELVGFIEERWNVKCADAELVPDNFDSIARITAYVAKKKEA